MTYIAGETLAAAQVAAVTGFSSTVVSRGDWKILSSGNGDHYAILKRGEMKRDWITGRFMSENFRTIIEVWQRVVTTDSAAYDALLNHCDNITTRFDQYRKLADTTGTLRDANVTGSGVVTEQWRNNADGPSWIKVDLYLDWSEESNVTFAE